MINKQGEIISSIPYLCVNYLPNKEKPTKVRCEKLGVLYSCKNYKGQDLEGCIFCKNQAIKINNK